MNDKQQRITPQTGTPGTHSKSRRTVTMSHVENPPSVLKRGTSSERRSVALGMNQRPSMTQEELKKDRVLVMKRSKCKTKQSQRDLTSSWNHPEIHKKPKYYPLAKTHQTLSLGETTILALLKSLYSCLRAMSCFAKYCNDPASAYVLTWEHVEFQIALWKMQTSNDEVVVEVIRRRGDPIAFHKYARDILDAVHGKFDAMAYEQQYGQSLDVRHLQDAEVLLHSQYPTTIEQDKKSCMASLATVYSLLTDGSLAARIMGMQSLCVLADPRMTGAATSVWVARIVLQGDHHGDRLFRDFCGCLISLIQNRDTGLRGDAPSSSDSDDSERPIQMQDSASLMHSLALAVLCHTLEAAIYLNELCPKPGSKQESVNEMILSFLGYAEKKSGKSIMKTLVNGLFNVEEEPHIACHCVIGLRLLCAASKHALQEAIKLDANDAADAAYRYGLSKHAKLETESSRFLQVLQMAH